jgi:hypothetical protein
VSVVRHSDVFNYVACIIVKLGTFNTCFHLHLQDVVASVLNKAFSQSHKLHCWGRIGSSTDLIQRGLYSRPIILAAIVAGPAIAHG